MNGDARAIGWKAHAALARTGGRWTALPDFDGSGYRLASGEPIWIGTDSVEMHPRTVVLERRARDGGGIDTREIVPWRLATLRFDRDAALAMRVGCAVLVSNIYRIGVARGFGALLAGTPLAFPLDGVAPQVIALADSIDRGNADAAFAAALPLLGLGPGLTPSGDDFVGAMLYGRRLGESSDAWRATSRRLVDAAGARTHTIGAALFRDLAEGQSFASLHRLTAALAEHRPALAAARDVTAIGHSSGWDMLAGFIIGCTGSAGLPALRTRAFSGNRKEMCA